MDFPACGSSSSSSNKGGVVNLDPCLGWSGVGPGVDPGMDPDVDPCMDPSVDPGVDPGVDPDVWAGGVLP